MLGPDTDVNDATRSPAPGRAQVLPDGHRSPVVGQHVHRNPGLSRGDDGAEVVGELGAIV